MHVRRSAFKHGIRREETVFALEHALAMEDLGRERTLAIGPRGDGQLLEIVIVRFPDGPAVIHAMKLRRSYHRFLGS